MPASLVHSAHGAILTSLLDSSTIGYVASALVLATFGMKDMVSLRMVAICSNFAFITYAFFLNLTPILILHAILLPLKVAVNIAKLPELVNHQPSGVHLMGELGLRGSHWM